MRLRASVTLKGDSRGQILPLFVISSVALLGLMGLGLDGARGFLERRQAQGAADLASLAGARSLPGGPGSPERTQAEADARALATANGYTSGVTVTFPDDNQIRVVIDSGIQLLFMPLLGMNSMEVDAAATAVREPEVTGEGQPLGGPAILAWGDECGANDNLKWKGANITVNGDVVTNAGGVVDGPNAIMNGIETWMDDPTCVPINQMNVVVGANPQPQFEGVTELVDYPLEEGAQPFLNPLQPGGLCHGPTVASLGLTLFLMGSNQPSYSSGTQLANGIYCRVDSASSPTALGAVISIADDSWCNNCTFVSLHVLFNAGLDLTPAIAVKPDGTICAMPANTCAGYPLLSYGASIDPKKGNQLKGDDIIWSGVLFAPRGLTHYTGHYGIGINGAIWSRQVVLDGHDGSLNGPSEWGITSDGEPLPEVLALVE